MSHFHHSLVLRCLFSLMLGTGVAWAFPPADYDTLFGMVRDQVGQTVTAEGAEVIISGTLPAWLVSQSLWAPLLSVESSGASSPSSFPVLRCPQAGATSGSLPR